MDSPATPKGGSATPAQDHGSIRRFSVDNPLFDDPGSPAVKTPDADPANKSAPGKERSMFSQELANTGETALPPGSPAPPTRAQLDAGWAALPRSLFRQVTILLPWHECRVVRRVCSAWRAAHGTAVAGLTPTQLKSSVVGDLFPSLVALDLTRVSEQPEADLKQQLVELSVSSGARLNSLKMPEGLEVDDLMLAVIASFGGLTNLGLQGTICPANGGSLMSLSPMRQLQALDLSSTKSMTDDAVECLSSLPALTQLSLTGNFEVSGKGLAALGDITALTNLNLEGCANVDDRVLEHLTRLSNLHTLNLSYCGQVTDKGLAAIAGPPSSSTLFAAGDTLAGVGAAFGEFGKNLGNTLGNTFRRGGAGGDSGGGGGAAGGNGGHVSASVAAPLPSLTSLSLSGCPDVTDTGLSSLGNLLHLRSLDLLGCWMVTGAGLTSLTGLSQLHSLSVEVKEGLDDDSMAAIACLRTLKHLRMERCKFCVTDRGIARLEEMTLHTMELAYCNGLTDVFVATVCHISTLTSLNLLKSDLVTQAGLAVITTLKHLRSLDLTGCNDVSDIIYLCLSRLTALEKLGLAYCSGWSEAGLESLAEVTSLRHLDLGYCYPLPDEAVSCLARGLTALTHLDLSGANQLTDAAFQSLGSLQRLERLELEGCCGLEREGLKAVAGLPLLNTLNLQDCQGLDSEALLLLTALQGLRDLNVVDCQGGTPEVVEQLIDSLPFLGNLAAL